MLRQNLRPTAPTVVALKNQIQSTKEQLDQLATEVGKNANGKPLSAVMGEYEQLDLERQFAQTMLTGSLQALDQARATAAAQHLYITPYVRPALPTSPDYWSRYTALARVSAGAFAFWLIALMITRSIRERFE
jgi:capsular polysaccharide transport system permease protein